jgi:hypothetical protein
LFQGCKSIRNLICVFYQRNILIKTLFELLWYHSGCFVIQICCMLSYMTLLQRDNTTLCDKICQWLAAGRWFSPGTTVSSTNKTYRHNITEILSNVVLNTIIPNSLQRDSQQYKQNKDIKFNKFFPILNMFDLIIFITPR